MKKTILSICVTILILMSFGLSVNAFDTDELSIKLEAEGYPLTSERGNTLITEFGSGNQSFSNVTEFDEEGNIVWQKTGLKNPQDAERLPNGNTLITEYGFDRVIEVDSNGDIVWRITGLGLPMDAERLPNGNTLISQFNNGKVIEVEPIFPEGGNIVWQITGLHKPFDAERLPNGHTLIVESELYPDGRVIEVYSVGGIVIIVWELTELDGPVDAERLDNGNTLITEHTGRRVFEVTKDGDIVWEKTGLLMPKDAEKLPNGNILITECAANRVIEVDYNTGDNVWVKSGLKYPVDAERINQPPDVPTIDGPNEGKPGVEYNFTINAIDPESDGVSYYIDWGDKTNSGWLGTYKSGETITVTHKWDKIGSFEIKAKARDAHGAESDWSDPFGFVAPRNKPFNKNPLGLRFLEQQPNLLPILRYLLGL